MQLPQTPPKEQGHQALLEAYLKALNLPMFLERIPWPMPKMRCVLGKLQNGS